MHLTRWLWAVLCLGRLMAAGPSRPESWTTTSDLRLRWSSGEIPAWEKSSARTADTNTVVVDPGRRFQAIYGMGASLEHTTCSNLARLGPSERDRALRLLVDPVDGIGMNLMRVCMGTSDFAGEDWYAYSEPGAGRAIRDVCTRAGGGIGDDAVELSGNLRLGSLPVCGISGSCYFRSDNSFFEKNYKDLNHE